MSKEVKKFRYTDSPDGTDIGPKFLLLLKPAAMTAFGISTIDVALYSHPKGYARTLARYAHFTFPILGATTAFVLTHNLLGTLRGQDCKWNWFAGGAATGAVYGVWRRSISQGFGVAVAMGLFTLFVKHSNDSGWVLFPEINPEIGSVRSVRHDWSLVKDRPGNWTTGTK